MFKNKTCATHGDLLTSYDPQQSTTHKISESEISNYIFNLKYQQSNMGILFRDKNHFINLDIRGIRAKIAPYT